MLTEIVARLLIEVYVAEILAGVIVPLPMRPGTFGENVHGAGALGRERLIGVERPVDVLGVEPAAYRHHGGLDVLQVRERVAGLPIVRVGVMRDQISPPLDLALEKPSVGIAQRPHAQEEIVAVRGAVIKARAGDFVFSRRGASKAGKETKRVRQKERAVMPPIVADKPFGHRRLGGDGFQRGMPAQGRHRGVEAGVGRARDADPAVVIRDGF